MKQEWIELNEIRDALSDDEAFIDIARIDVFHFRGHQIQVDWSLPHYVAWVTRSSETQASTVVDLGLATEIDELVQRVRNTTNAITSDAVTEHGEEGLTNLLMKDLQSLADRVWNPLEPHLDSIDKVVLCPDGALWLAPWNTLPVGEQRDQYLIERYGVRFVTSGRDLVRRFDQVETNSPVILANPSFDQLAKQKQASIAAIFQQSPAVNKRGCPIDC